MVPPNLGRPGQAVKLHLSHQSKRFLVSLHVICAMGWTGSVLAVLFLLRSHKDAPLALAYASARLCQQIDDQLIIPFAMLSLVSGLALCAMTSWGFIKHWWVIAKGLLTVAFIVFGTIALGPWLNKSAAIAIAASPPWDQPIASADPHFLHLANLLSLGIPPQFFLLLFVVVVSYVKPWGTTPWRRK